MRGWDRGRDTRCVCHQIHHWHTRVKLGKHSQMQPSPGAGGKGNDDKRRKRLLVKQPEIRKEKQLLGEKSQPGGGKRMVAGGMGSLESCRAGVWGSKPHVCGRELPCLCQEQRHVAHPRALLGEHPHHGSDLQDPPPGLGQALEPPPQRGVAESAGLGQLGGIWGRAGRWPPRLSLKLGVQGAPREPPRRRC